MGHDLSYQTLVKAIQDIHMVVYAFAGLDNNLFVSKYHLELPKKEDVQRFLEEKIKEVAHGELEKDL